MVAVPSGAGAQLDVQPARPALAKAQLNFKAWIENKAAMPATVILIVSLVLRSAQAWSFGAFSLNMLPHVLQITFDVLTGIGAALGMELLMSAAGAQWFKLRYEAVMAQFDTGKAKKQREAEAKLMEERALIFGGFTLLGALASISGSVYFALTSTRNHTPMVVAADVLLALVITAGVFFFGVIYEPARPDSTLQAQEHIQDRLNEVTLDIAGRVGDGSASPEHIAFLKGRVSPTYARQLDALMPRESGMEYWDAPKIARWLGDVSDAAQRDIRRKLQRAQSIPELGVRNKATGRGLEAPQSAMLAIFQGDIERRMTMAPERSLTGESAAQSHDLASDGTSGAGQPAGRSRRTSGPRALMEAEPRADVTPDWLTRLGITADAAPASDADTPVSVS